MILILRMKAKDYESFCIKAAPILGPWASLPELAAPWRFPWRFGRVSGFISFAANWEPSFLAFTVPYFIPFKGRANYALRPVFEKFGLEWQPEPIPDIRIATFLYFFLAFLVVLLISFL